MSFALYLGVAIGVFFFSMFMAGVVKEDYMPDMVGGVFAVAVLWPLILSMLAILASILVVFYLPYYLGTKL